MPCAGKVEHDKIYGEQEKFTEILFFKSCIWRLQLFKNNALFWSSLNLWKQLKICRFLLILFNKFDSNFRIFYAPEVFRGKTPHLEILRLRLKRNSCASSPIARSTSPRKRLKIQLCSWQRQICLFQFNYFFFQDWLSSYQILRITYFEQDFNCIL